MFSRTNVFIYWCQFIVLWQRFAKSPIKVSRSFEIMALSKCGPKERLMRRLCSALHWACLLREGPPQRKCWTRWTNPLQLPLHSMVRPLNTHTHTRARNQNDFIAVQSQISSGFYSLRLIQKYMSLHRILSANRPVWFCGWPLVNPAKISLLYLVLVLDY